MNKLTSVLTLAITLTTTTVLAKGDANQGKVKAQSCVACHGVQGNSTAPNFPKLAGQSQQHLIKQLKNFKSGSRQDAIMTGIVAGLSDTDIRDLAAYFAKQTISQGAAQKTANLVLGAKLYRGGDKSRGIAACIACHGPQGAGIPSANFPALASQHSAYVVKQLKAFRQVSLNKQTDGNAPKRTNDERGMMIRFTKYLTNAEIEALAQYIAGLH